MTKEKAIEMLQNDMKLNHCTWSNEETEAVKMAIEALAQPEQKKGKWIGGELGYCTCCGHEGCASDMWDRCDHPYCPNCGAEMEV